MATLAMVHYNLRIINKWAKNNNLEPANVYAATSETELVQLLEAAGDRAAANAPPIAA